LLHEKGNKNEQIIQSKARKSLSYRVEAPYRQSESKLLFVYNVFLGVSKAPTIFPCNLEANEKRPRRMWTPLDAVGEEGHQTLSMCRSGYEQNPDCRESGRNRSEKCKES
jgi:hypothetical protein